MELETYRPMRAGRTYLAQGRFRVYLVRTAAPVYNTTLHVLNHIVFADDGMLAVGQMANMKHYPHGILLRRRTNPRDESASD